MKTSLAMTILGLVLSTGAAQAQSCQTIGNSTFCSDGSSANRVGNTTFVNPPPSMPSYNAPTYQPSQPYQYAQPSRVCSRIGQTTICN